MNFRRKHNREHGARGHSSEWRYPQTIKGDDSRSRYATKRRATAFEQELAEWMKDPEFAEAYNRARAAVEAFEKDGRISIPRGSANTDL